MPGDVKLAQFSGGSLVKGVNLHTPDFQGDIELTASCLNVTSGINQGIGPRYGFAPLPGQLDNEAVASGQGPGFRAAETTWTASYYNRQFVYAIWPISLGGADSAAALANRQTFYAAVTGAVYTNVMPSDYLLDVVFLSTETGGVWQQSPNFYAGLGPPALFGSAQQVHREFLQANGSTVALTTFQGIPQGTAYVGSAPFSINNPNVASNWLIGITSYGTVNGATTAPSLEMTQQLAFIDSGTSRNISCFAGLTSDIVTGNFIKGNHTPSVYALDIVANQNIDYNLTFAATTSIFEPAFTLAPPGYPEINLGSTTATKTSAGTSYGNTYAALYNDNQTFTNSSYQGVLVAAGKAMAFLVQDWQRSIYGGLPQYVDLVNNPLTPQAIQSFHYEEAGTLVNTALAYWPVYVPGTPMAASGPIQLNGAGSGLLRANTLYEISFSVFNKRLNCETNVGPGVKVQTGANDFVSIQVWDSGFVGGSTTQAAYLLQSGFSMLPWPGPATGVSTITGNSFSINHLEYRFYYRQVGLSEWLPALFMDAAQWWFYPHHTNLSLCNGGIGGLPGGRPGGYSDYSPLPADQYDCVVMYKNRAFWFSDKAMCFSLMNNLFAYPTGNTAACPVGAFKGAIVATYYGQAQQQARLVIFSTQGTYIGIFTGNPTLVPVQVDPTTIASFPLDGSDFELNAWTSVSAFSYRAAVVAEGILYFWGPDGVFMDDGVNPITRISVPLEPDIFQFYAAAQTDQIHAVYNNNTKEITWFYPPKVADSTNPTHGLVYNRAAQTWLPTAYAGQVDASQAIKIDSPIPTAGSRTMVFSRQNAATALQRPFFYDEQNLAGDIYPGSELLVKAISTPSAGLRRFTLAAGYSPSFSSLKVGDIICAQQVAAYATTLTSPTDFIGTVAALGSGTIDITLPTGVSFDSSATLATNNLFFPIYHAAAAYSTAQNSIVLTGTGLNGFNFMIPTKYWIPQGIAYWGLWLYVHMVFKLREFLPTTVPLDITFAHRTPISQGYVSEILTLQNNSDNNYQIFHHLTLGNQNLEGQGLAIQWSGIQVGSNWVLEFVEAFSQPYTGLQLKHFEG